MSGLLTAARCGKLYAAFTKPIETRLVDSNPNWAAVTAVLKGPIRDIIDLQHVDPSVLRLRVVLLPRSTVGPIFHPRRAFRLNRPAPKATICRRPPAIATFLKKWMNWFWSAKWLWNASAAAIENAASSAAATRAW